ncbi:MAG: 1-deoxy-D-xylulose-5-phosphate reductoisomerase [Hyphomonadaceae bacterium]|nr:1-deoxy-D-xylulose-5-phosphate reductoisomerase [Hyphomonadaceae bacterium]
MRQVAPAARPAGPAPLAGPGRRRITVLGATGSVGKSTLDLIGRNPHLFEVVALSANRDAKGLAELALLHRAQLAVLADESRYAELKDHLAGTGIEAAAGAAALIDAASRPADCVMAGIIGAAGLRPTLAAVSQGRRVALANKECLVCAGKIFMQAVHGAGTELMPVDSEHSAVFQVLAGADPEAFERIVLTGSGGPFRTWSLAQLERVTPEQALQHPNWSMGRKITIDSATLMNKGLELIEAYHLFPVRADQLDVVVHPQQIIHALVAYRDGSMLAQLACPDMRTPIAISLAWPMRMATPTKRLDLTEIGQFTFERPDEARFKALGLARQALANGGMAPAVLNAANEVAVEAFLTGRLKFLHIPQLVAETLEMADGRGLLAEAGDLGGVLATDAAARELALFLLNGRAWI